MKYSEHDPIFGVFDDFKKYIETITLTELDQLWEGVNGFKFSVKYGNSNVNESYENTEIID